MYIYIYIYRERERKRERERERNPNGIWRDIYIYGIIDLKLKINTIIKNGIYKYINIHIYIYMYNQLRRVSRNKSFVYKRKRYTDN